MTTTEVSPIPQPTEADDARVAPRFGIDQTQVSNIVRGKQWLPLGTDANG